MSAKKNCPSCGRLGPKGRWEGQWVGGLTYLHLFFKCSSHDTNLVPITKTQDKYMNLQWPDPQLTIDSQFLEPTSTSGTLICTSREPTTNLWNTLYPPICTSREPTNNLWNTLYPLIHTLRNPQTTSEHPICTSRQFTSTAIYV